MRYHHDIEDMRAATITLKRTELLYDIGQDSYTEGDLMPEDSGHAQHLTQDIAECSQIDRTTRIMNLAYSECVELLYPYTKVQIDKEEGLTLDDKLSEPEEYVFQLENLPATVSATSIELLRNLLHEFIVCRVLQDRLDITKAEVSGKWQAKLDEIKRGISGVLCRRIKKVRRTLSPF